MNRPVAALELYDMSQASTGPPLLRLRLPALIRGASVLSFQLAYNPSACVHERRSPFYVDPAATIVVAVLRVMAPSAEGTGVETIIFIIPIPKLERLVEEHANRGTAMEWMEWGPSSTRAFTIPDCEYVPDWILRSSINGYNFAATTCDKSLLVFNMNPATASTIGRTKGWSAVDSQVDSWAFEDVIQSSLECWRCSTDISRLSPESIAAWAIIEDSHIVVMTLLVCAASSVQRLR
jgi:hypothetical protein